MNTRWLIIFSGGWKISLNIFTFFFFFSPTLLYLYISLSSLWFFSIVYEPSEKVVSKVGFKSDRWKVWWSRGEEKCRKEYNSPALLSFFHYFFLFDFICTSEMKKGIFGVDFMLLFFYWYRSLTYLYFLEYFWASSPQRQVYCGVFVTIHL